MRRRNRRSAVELAFATEHPGVRVLCGPRGQPHARNRQDARQRFAAKPEAGDAFQVTQTCDLAGGMPLKCQRQLILGNSCAVIAHANEADTSLFQLDVDTPRPGIETVLDQLLDNGGGAFDHLAGGDLVDQLIGQNADHPDSLRRCRNPRSGTWRRWFTQRRFAQDRTSAR